MYENLMNKQYILVVRFLFWEDSHQTILADPTQVGCTFILDFEKIVFRSMDFSMKFPESNDYREEIIYSIRFLSQKQFRTKQS